MVNLKPELSYSLYLTQAKGKIRVKQRSVFKEYGIPVATRQEPMTNRCYVEWQIGYDATKEDLASGKKETSLKAEKYNFVGANGKTKNPFELSEILYHSFEKGLLTQKEIKECYKNILDIDKTIENREDMQITRTEPMTIKIDELEFYKMQVAHPLLVHRFGKYEIFAEILINEKQFAVGTQPMLYVCLPIDALKFETEVIGRTLNSNESGKWIIGKEEAKLTLELFKVFALLTDNHKHDVLELLKVMFDFI